MKVSIKTCQKITKGSWFIFLAGVIFLAGCNSLTIENDGNGLTDPSGEIKVQLNKATEISATPNTGYTFDSWTIVSGTGVTFDNNTSSDTSVTLTETDATIRADFLKQFILTINNDGNGTTLPSGGVTVDNGTATSISATPDTGSIFSGWTIVSGTGVTIDNATSANTTVILTETNATIRADFIKQYTLTVTVDGEGTTIPTGIMTVDNGTATSISATADTGWIFSGWTIVSGTGVTINDDTAASTSVTLTGTSASIRADFLKTPKLYVTNYDGESVSVIDGLTGAIDDTIDLSSASYPPAAIGVNPNTNKIYVIHDNDNATVLDGSSNTVSKTIDFYIATDYPGVAVNPVTNKIFIAATYDTDIIVLDGSTDTELGSFYTDFSDYDGCYPNGIAVNPVTDKLYIIDWADEIVYVYEGSDPYAKITEMASGESDDLGGIAVNSVTNKIYVPDTVDSLYIFDGSTDTPSTNITVGTNPYGVAVNETTNMIYVTNMDDDTVSVVNGTTDTVSTTISVGNQPLGVAVSKNLNRIYVVNSADNSTSIINGSTNTVINTVTVGGNPRGIDVLE